MKGVEARLGERGLLGDLGEAGWAVGALATDGGWAEKKSWFHQRVKGGYGWGGISDGEFATSFLLVYRVKGKRGGDETVKWRLVRVGSKDATDLSLFAFFFPRSSSFSAERCRNPPLFVHSLLSSISSSLAFFSPY